MGHRGVTAGMGWGERGEERGCDPNGVDPKVGNPNGSVTNWSISVGTSQ